MQLPLLMTQASIISQVAFIGICSFILIALLLSAVFCQNSKVSKIRTALWLSTGIMIYCFLIIRIVDSGVLIRAFIPYGPIFFLGTILISISLAFTPFARHLGSQIPIAYLVGFQGFRLPLEIVLHDWYKSGTIPETMTWTGSNWDIFSGVLACIACRLVTKRRWLAWSVNILGIALLLNVIQVAIMSSPIPFGWKVDPPLELILYLPYAFIVPICIGGAAFGHVLLTRRLLAMGASQ